MNATSIRRAPLHAWHGAALALALFSFFMAALVSRAVFERLPHLEDEIAYLFQARVFARGHVAVPIMQPTRGYWQPFVVDYAPTGLRFSKYPPGWSAALALGEAAGQGWIVNALAAALAVVLVYRLGLEVFSRDVGLIGASLTAFSPAALLLNGTLMAHSVSLACASAFMWAYWRMERANEHQRPAWSWGAACGVLLGLLAITRPSPALALALPFAAWSGARLLRYAWRDGVAAAWRRLAPLLILAVLALGLSRLSNAYNQAVTGNPDLNLYTLVWDYDRIGFGEGYGRSGHTLEKAFRHARFDLSLTAADLFGWQVGEFSADVRDGLLSRASYYPNLGLSFIILPFGVLGALLWGARSARARLARLLIFGVWLAGALGWALLPLRVFPTSLIQDAAFSWLWIIVGLGWILWPSLAVVLLGSRVPQLAWGWLLVALALTIIVVQMTYWIGSQRYSTRYWYEALGAVSLIAALPLAWVVQRGKTARLLGYGALIVVLLASLYTYSQPRISLLHRFNLISPQLIQDVMAQRVDDRPILAIVNGPSTGDSRVRWFTYGALMAATSPFYDGPLSFARDSGGARSAILARFPHHQIVDLDAEGTTIRLRTP
ncbi:MAG: glycosyltransferase family 39 protein [Anaerolineae bacterium]|nr:glycosyltransferase family 39 protein [Anaerolineae bacterium]MDW8172905.1 glycosyltransferase family 39 protein [Anaerolineae bacterium]